MHQTNLFILFLLIMALNNYDGVCFTRDMYLKGWYNQKEIKLYRRYIVSKDEKGLATLHKKHMNGLECPACELKRLRKKDAK